MMSKNPDLTARQRLFPLKVLACFFGLLATFFVFSPDASMQNESEHTMSNVAVVVNNSVNANYRPTPMPMNGMMNRMVNGGYSPLPEPPKSTVRGRVIYSDTGRAVRRAGLMLFAPRDASGGNRENGGVTNERGEFEIRDVAEGRYFVSVNAPGVLTPLSALSNFERPPLSNTEDLADITKDFQEIVVNGVTDTDVTITAQRGAAISGRVGYADGDPAIGVRVEVLRKKDGRYTGIISNIGDVFGAMFGGSSGLKTDDRGVFRVSGLPAGEYVVRALENVSHTEKKTGRDDEMMMLTGINPGSMVSTYFPGTDDVKKAEILKVELGQEYPEISITIPERNLKTLKGIVVNKATRQPLKEARVNLQNADGVNPLFAGIGGGSEFGSKNQSDEQGRWNFKDLPAGKYTLTVEPPYIYDAPDESNPAKPKPKKFTRWQKEIVIENEKETEDLIVELGYGATVSGTIVFDDRQDLPNTMAVAANDEKGKFSQSASVYTKYSNDGKPLPQKSEDFKIESIPNGRIFLNLGATNYGEQDTAKIYVKSILLDGRDVRFSPLEIKEGEEVKGVRIVISKDVGKLKGKVARADKSPAAGAWIHLVPTDRQKWTSGVADLYAVTNGDGDFETSGAPGEYFVILSKSFARAGGEDPNQDVNESRRAWLEKETVSAQKVTLRPKETETLSLTLPD